MVLLKGGLIRRVNCGFWIRLEAIGLTQGSGNIVILAIFQFIFT